MAGRVPGWDEMEGDDWNDEEALAASARALGVQPAVAVAAETDDDGSGYTADEGIPRLRDDSGGDEEGDEMTGLLGRRKRARAASAQRCGASSVAYQTAFLIVLSLVPVAAQFSYDSIGALAPLLKKRMNIESEAIAALYSVYHLPNLVMVAFGGLFVDSMGVHRAGFMFSCFVLAGSAVVAASSTLQGMLVGRFLLGLGGESLNVWQMTLIYRWFTANTSFPTLAVACSISLLLGRAGSLACYNVLPLFGLHGVPYALALVAAIAGVALLLTVVVAALDWRARATRAELRAASSSASAPSLKEIVAAVPRFCNSYWLLVLLCIFFYSALVPFMEFSADFFHESWAYTAARASRATSYVTAVVIVLLPAAGWLVDFHGHRCSIMLAGTLLFLPGHMMLVVLPSIPPEVACVVLGVAYSLIGAALWPSVGFVVSSRMMGTAMGLLTALQNTALFLAPIIVGSLHDATGSYAQSMSFFIVLDWLAVVCAYALLREDARADGVLQLSAAAAKLAVAQGRGGGGEEEE